MRINDAWSYENNIIITILFLSSFWTEIYPKKEIQACRVIVKILHEELKEEFGKDKVSIHDCITFFYVRCVFII